MRATTGLSLLRPGRIGKIKIGNRFIRSATAETLEGEAGFITEALATFAALDQAGVSAIH